MSVQRYTADGYGAQQGEMMPDPEGPWMLAADHARIVADMEQSHALALAKQKAQCIEHQANAVAAERENHAAALLTQDRQHMEALAEAVQRGRAEQLLYPSATAHEPAAAPRTLTADDVLAAVNAIDYDAVLAATPAPKTARAQVYTLHALTRDAILTLIHDGEATPQVKPCSTCGEPVAYLTARPGWAGGWLHHPARPLDGHPAAIDEEATP